MLRTYTKGEVGLIADAIRFKAESLQEQANKLLGGFGIDELADLEEVSEGISNMAKGIAIRAKAYQEQANKLWNLAFYVEHHGISSEVLIILPEQA